MMLMTKRNVEKIGPYNKDKIFESMEYIDELRTGNVNAALVPADQQLQFWTAKHPHPLERNHTLQYNIGKI